jgi:hypothetical protein
VREPCAVRVPWPMRRAMTQLNHPGFVGGGLL